MSNIEKIRQEIERRIGSVNEKQDANPAMPKYRWHMFEGMKEAFLDMKYFIDSLPEEIPPYCTGFKGDPDPAGVWKPSEEQMEALLNTLHPDDPYYPELKSLYEQLLKGSPLPEDTVLFQKGVEEGKRLMMEDAVEGVVYRYESYQKIATAIIVDIPREILGNKVKIIIVKEKEG